MDSNKMRYIRQNQAKVYICTFQLDLIQLRIFLRFPCKFFVQWKTVNTNESIRTVGTVEYKDGKALFNQKLKLEVEMIHDDSKNNWIRKDSSINVYLITKSKPDFNQLAGRLNIDLSKVCSDNPYKSSSVQSLTYSSTNSDLKFNLDLKYSIKSKKQISQIDLLSFNDRLYLVKHHPIPNDILNKSKSMDYLKNSKNIVSPVYQLVDSSKDKERIHQKKQIVPLHFPLSKLESFGHQAKYVQNIQPQSGQSDQIEQLRMTLGTSKKFSKQDYDTMIQQQTHGMKKSNLIYIPDMKKSHIEEDDSQFNTNTQKPSKQVSEEDFIIDLSRDNKSTNEKIKDMGMKKISSQKPQQQKRSNSPQQSDVDIVIDLQSKPSINPNDKRIVRNSMNSSNNSFSISKFNAQYENGSQQKLDKVKSAKNSVTSVQFHTGFQQFAQNNYDQIVEQNSKLRIQCQNNKNRIKQLENDISQLVKILTNSRDNFQQQKKQRQNIESLLNLFQIQNKSLKNKLNEYEQKHIYQSKINEINCQKLKTVHSQLTIQRKRSQSLLSIEDPKIKVQIKSTRSKCASLEEQIKRLKFQNASLEQKLYKRDQIQLQNQIKIQQLQEQLEKYRTQRLNNAPKNMPSKLQINSTIKPEYKTVRNNIKQNNINQQQILIQNLTQISTLNEQKQKLEEYQKFLQEKLIKFEQQNLRVKQIIIEYQKTLQFYVIRDNRMRQNLSIIEVQFRSVAESLIKKEKQLKQIQKQMQLWKKKSFSTHTKSSQTIDKVINSPTSASQINQTLNIKKIKELEQQVKKKQDLLNFCENQIHLLEQELFKLQNQNKQLEQSYHKLLIQSSKYDGQLNTIKQEQSYRQSFASSNQIFFNKSTSSFSLSIVEENIISSYKEAVNDFYLKKGTHDPIDINLKIQLNQLRTKIFQQLERSTKIINGLFIDNQILQTQKTQLVNEKQKIKVSLQEKIYQLQNKIQLLQETQRNSAGSTLTQPNNFLKPVQQKLERFSQSTKKRALNNLNSQSQLNREIQKLKSIIYDKNKQMSDLIVSYQKLKIQKQTQSTLLKNSKVQIGGTNITNIDEDDAEEHLVHDILDLQIRLNKQKQQKNQIMQQLEVRKSLNRSQQISQYIQQSNNADYGQICKQLNQIIQSRQQNISKEQPLHRLVNRINQLQEKLQKVQNDYKLIYHVEQKSRAISRQMQKMKSSILKMSSKDIETMQYKSKFMTILKPCQNSVSQLLVSVQNMVNYFV